jgi:threonine dehydrogenase-like Zn-dependent dehydrogenase
MPAPHAAIEIRELAEPALEPGAVLLEVVASEVCGTDVHLHHGRLAGVPYPIIPGHVSVGCIEAANGVTHDALGAPVAPGDVVTFYDVHGTCGRCWYCTSAALPNRCPERRVYGITMSATDGPFGGWATKILLKPGTQLIRLPQSVSADAVIAGGCGLFTGFAAVERSGLGGGSLVVVQGAGPVGLGAAICALERGASQVTVIGEPAARRELAGAFGAAVTLPLAGMSTAERVARVREMTGGRGADVVIEASGNPEALPEALELLRDGGTLVIAGHYTDRGTVPLNPHVINRKHATVLGQWGTAFRHLKGALDLLVSRGDSLPIRRLIGGRYSLEEANRALADVAALRVTKAVIAPAS